MSATGRSTGQSGAPAVRAHVRVLAAFGAGVVAGSALLAIAPWQVAVLGGWSASALLFVGWLVARLWHLDARQTEQHATLEDASRPLADGLVLAAALASLAAIGVALVKASRAHGPGKAAIVAVAVLSVFGSWAVVHAVFTLRYARIYFLEGGGIEFNEDDVPDYRDFTYMALTVGMTFQVSDTNIGNKAIRRTITKHAVVSYLLGAVIIAMAINVIAGLLNH
jgi:uncharacterized membrane protein